MKDVIIKKVISIGVCVARILYVIVYNMEIKIMNKVYFAGPLFCQSEKDYNIKLASVLEKAGYKVFLPQRDGLEAALIKNKTQAEVAQMIFEKDTSEILSADIFFMVLDGRVPDDGACVELGIAYASNKRCYGAKTDARALEIGLDLNPLISGCFSKIFYNLNGNELMNELKAYLSMNKL